MKLSQNLTWQDESKTRTAAWQSEAGHPPPKTVVIADDTMTADAAYWRACAGTALLYNGDFQNAKQLLQAVTRRVDRKAAKPAATMLEAFHQHRLRQIGRANITNKILIELQDGKCNLNRAPDLQEAVAGALGEKTPANLVLSLRETLGMIGANEWRKKGVYIEALEAKIHANYGVYSPVRGEYLDVINQVQLNSPQVAWDIGTGTGVIAAVLVARGVQQVIATDTSARALQCAAENIQRLNMQTNISLVETNLFPEAKADLIVCNPPWVPAKVNTPIESAVYDPKSQMLKGFLNGARARLNKNGEAWLVMSNLAENIGLRSSNDLQDWMTQAGLILMEKADTSPKHAKSVDQSDPLYEARSREVTSLYRLKAAD
ncbi:MAG: class I SAM-dependent methyltransferase [Fuerstiella sp.]